MKNGIEYAIYIATTKELIAKVKASMNNFYVDEKQHKIYVRYNVPYQIQKEGFELARLQTNQNKKLTETGYMCREAYNGNCTRPCPHSLPHKKDSECKTYCLLQKMTPACIEVDYPSGSFDNKQPSNDWKRKIFKEGDESQMGEYIECVKSLIRTKTLHKTNHDPLTQTFVVDYQEPHELVEWHCKCDKETANPCVCILKRGLTPRVCVLNGDTDEGVNWTKVGD